MVAINSTVSVITLSINDLNVPIKRQHAFAMHEFLGLTPSTRKKNKNKTSLTRLKKKKLDRVSKNKTQHYVVYNKPTLFTFSVRIEPGPCAELLP
jgi:hypothetical protein